MTTRTILACGAALAASALAASTALAGERVSLDRGWSFSLNGGAVQTVDVPHDWSVTLAPAAGQPSDGAGGYYPGGVGTYERTFELAAADLALDLELVFDGVYRDAEVSVNGGAAAKGSFYGYTGFTVPLAAKDLKAGANTLRVVARNDAQPNCRWYSGSGIYRHVWLEKRAKGEAKAEAVDWTKFPKVEWSAEKGLLVDGVPTHLHGACVHHDHGPLGAASYDEAEVRKVRQLKRAGFNAVRTSHNPVSEAFLDACDREGLWVVDDMFDGWTKAKTKHDYAKAFKRDWEKDLRWIVRRDRRHPSVLIWSIGNEILERASAEAANQAAAMAKACREEDPLKRPVTEAMCTWEGDSEWFAQDKMIAHLDMAGYNYEEEYIERDHARDPKRVIVCTETFPKDAAKLWRIIREKPYVIGEFVWTGIDYLGEATIGRTYYEGRESTGEHYEVKPAFPWHGAYCGDIDLTGWRKPISHYRETLWNENAPTCIATREPNGWKGEIHVTRWSVWPTWESWNYEGWEGKPVTVEIYSRKPQVTLTLNGKVVGTAKNGPENAYLVSFEVPYEPGVLACDGAVLKTAGAFDHFRYSKETIGRLAWVVAEAVDRDGTVCPWAAEDVTFEGDVIATCSADMTDSVPAPSRTRRTWRGRAMAVVRER